MSSVSTTGPSRALPLAVDMDGSLVATDTLVELGLAMVRQSPWRVFEMLGWLRAGKANLKARLAMEADLDVDLLPLNEALVAYLESQAAAGRQLVLVTAANERIAQRVASRVGIFDDVMASSADVNLRGSEKARRLVERFGENGFTYVGNERADLPVWAASGSAVTVNVPSRVVDEIQVPVDAQFGHSPVDLRAIRSALRVHQWIKNLLVFLPMVTANALLDAQAWPQAILTFALFSILASGVYILNDLADLEADRAHPRKRARPFASGRLPLLLGVVAGPLMMGGSLMLAALWNPTVLVYLLVYAALTIAYSLVLKTLPLVDVFSLAVLYTLRIAVGGAATGYTVSIWLLSFSSLVFLALAFLKRVVEVSGEHARDAVVTPRRGYFANEHGTLTMMGVASSFASTIVLALYVDSNVASQIYRTPVAVWGLVPLCLFWQCRMWLSAARGYVHDDPIVYAARDWVSWAVVAASGLCYLVAVR